jgi:hypothetical protein
MVERPAQHVNDDVGNGSVGDFSTKPAVGSLLVDAALVFLPFENRVDLPGQGLWRPSHLVKQEFQGQVRFSEPPVSTGGRGHEVEPPNGR